MKSLLLNQKCFILTLSILLAVCIGQRVYAADCQVGDTLSAGESCTYPGTDIGFSVNNDGKAQFNNLPQGLPWWLRLLFGGKFEDSVNVNANFNGVAYKFKAIQRADGSWEIRVVGENVAKPPPPPVQKPDLVVSSARVNDATLEPGQRFTLSVIVRNSGNGGSAATMLRYYRSGDNRISTRDTQVGTDRIGALAANRTSNQNISLTAPATPGTYYYGACVDAVASESSFDNNCSTAVSVTVQQITDPTPPAGGTTYNVGEDIPTLPTGIWFPNTVLGGGGGAQVSIGGGTTTVTFGNGGAIINDGITYTCVDAGECKVEGRRVTRGTIQASGGGQTPPPAQQPDLVVEAVQVQPTTVAPGQEFKLYATLRNNGTGASAATTVRYYRSSDNIISTGDTQLGTGNRDPLAPNGTIRRHLVVTAPAAPGAYYYGVCADSVTGEGNTSNNCSPGVRLIVQQPDTEVPGSVVVPPSGTSVVASTPSPLTEVTLHGSIVTLTLNGATFERSRIDIGNALTISGIPGLTLGSPAWFNVDRVSDTKITVELEFAGNIDTDSTLTLTLGSDAIANYTGAALMAQLPVTAVTESVVASTPSPLTEATLHGSVVTLTLNGKTYERSRIDIGNALTVSGLPGVTIGTRGAAWFGVERVSDTKITVELGFTGNIDTDATLTLTVGAAAIANYDGQPLTAQLPVTAVTESVVASTPSPLTEVTLHESVVTLTLNGKTYERSRIDIGNALTISGIPGLTLGSPAWFNVDRVSDTKITVELEFAGNIDTDSTLTLTLGSDAIANYTGAALTAQLPVTAVTEWVVASTTVPLTKATLNESVVTLTLTGHAFEPYAFRISDAVKVSGIAGVTIGSFRVNRVSDTQIAVELEFDERIAPVGTLTFTIGAEAIANYDGPTLTARLSVPTKHKREDNGDVNGDGVISIQDIILIASSFGQTGQHPADVNGDGAVDIKDLIAVAGVLDVNAAAPALHPHSFEMATAADIRQWLSQARRLSLTDATSQRGVMFLENLLATLTPKETALLPNYPNPFNPETWIPYRLANDTDVSLCIYDMDGALVRELDLGHQRAGYYTDRGRAAYWDGRNEWGERVASGVYFFQLRADSLAPLRNMVIVK